MAGAVVGMTLDVADAPVPEPDQFGDQLAHGGRFIDPGADAAFARAR